MEETTAETENSENPRTGPAAMRHPLDWLLTLCLCAIGPLLLLFAGDFAFRTDLVFFPLLVVVPLTLIVWRGRFQEIADRIRAISSVVLWGVSGVVALGAGLLFSPWLAVLALLLAATGWMLLRFAGLSWYLPVAWSIPAWLLLLLPLSDATNLIYPFQTSVAQSAGYILDIIGVFQLPTNAALETQFGRVAVSEICGGLGNPYLLLSLVVLLSLLLGRSFLVGLLSTLSVPAWAWFGAVLHLVVGVWLAEVHEIYLLSGTRGILMQAAMLVMLLLCIWLFQIALLILFAPFTAHSAGVDGMQKLFNWVVLWPARDPLRKRKSLEFSQAIDTTDGGFMKQRGVLVTLAAVGLFFLIGGGVSLATFLSGSYFVNLRTSDAAIQAALTSDALPAELEGMPQLDFISLKASLVSVPGTHVARWSYLLKNNRLEITLALPMRGAYPAERDYLSTDNRLLGPGPQQFLAGERQIYQVSIADPLVGSSYLCYANFALDAQPTEGEIPLQDAPMDVRQSLFERLADRLTYQPTTASLRLFVEGAGNLTDEERQQLRSILGQALQSLQPRIVRAVSPGQ